MKILNHVSHVLNTYRRPHQLYPASVGKICQPLTAAAPALRADAGGLRDDLRTAGFSLDPKRPPTLRGQLRQRNVIP